VSFAVFALLSANCMSEIGWLMSADWQSLEGEMKQHWPRRVPLAGAMLYRGADAILGLVSAESKSAMHPC